jgi:hypothetical protein
MRHESLPFSMTPEQLADYIRSNRIDSVNHVEKFPLSENEKKELALKSSNAGQAILRLESQQKYVTKLIKKGTPWDTNRGEDGDHRPIDITIPPTAGLDVLKSNRQYADEQIEKGYREEVTCIYFLPWPEYEKMIGLDIEGTEWSKYSRQMTKEEIRQHGKPILRAAEELVQGLDDAGIEIEKVDGNQVHLKKKKKRDLLDDEQPI